MLYGSAILGIRSGSEEHSTAVVGVEGGHAPGRYVPQVLFFFVGELRLHGLRYAQRDLALDGEYVLGRQLAFVRFRPQVLVGLGVDELDIDPDAVSGPTRGALEDVSDPYFPADLGNALLGLCVLHHRRA